MAARRLTSGFLALRKGCRPSAKSGTGKRLYGRVHRSIYMTKKEKMAAKPQRDFSGPVLTKS